MRQKTKSLKIQGFQKFKKNTGKSLPDIIFKKYPELDSFDIRELNPLTFFGKYHTNDSPIEHQVTFVPNSRIGKGGNGQVFFAAQDQIKKNPTNKPANSPKAFKVIPLKKDPEARKKQIESIEYEHALMTNVDYLNVRPLVRKENCYIIVMNFIAGKDLFDILIDDEEALCIPLLMDITDKLLSAYQHQVVNNQFIHRDIKPENIRYNDETGDLTIFDLGLALQFGQVDSNAVGSYEYIAPEIAFECNSNHEKKYSTACDIYALGKTLAYIWVEFFDIDLLPSLTGANPKNFIQKINDFDTNIKKTSMFKGCENLIFIKELIVKMVEFNPEARFTITEAIEFFNLHRKIYDDENQSSPVAAASSSTNPAPEKPIRSATLYFNNKDVENTCSLSDLSDNDSYSSLDSDFSEDDLNDDNIAMSSLCSTSF